MHVIFRGSTGPAVEAWQVFLRGNVDRNVNVNSTFDDATFEATKLFQRKNKLDDDGIVGTMTYGAAMLKGFNPGVADDRNDAGPNWPPKPPSITNLSTVERDKLFEPLNYVASPTKTNPEAIQILDGWENRNIVKVVIKQLAGVKGASKSGTVQFNSKCAQQLVKMFDDWESAGLIDRILTFGGTWAPRFVRGSTKTLSGHALGTAIDFNMEWNALGTNGALKGQQGSVRELVEIAVKNGFFWGRWFKARPDPMHFEIFKIIT